MQLKKVVDINFKIYIKKYFWVGILLAQLLLFTFLKSQSFFIDFHKWFYAGFHPILQAVFSVVPFSFGDVYYVVLVFFLFFFVVKKKWAKLLHFVNVFYFVFQLLWGVLYVYRPISDRLPKLAYTSKDLKRMANFYFEKCLSAQFLTEVSDDNIETDLHQSLAFIPKDFLIFKQNTPKSSKTSLYSSILSYTGISGYYNPFTAEAQYNEHLPSSIKTFSLAHEMAHQLGYAREQEASFVGYLILKNSNNSRLNYWANWYNLKRILSELQAEDEGFVNEMKAQFSAKMKKDLELEKAFFLAHQSYWMEVFYTTNDWFLRLNNQEGSITYSYYLELLMRYELRGVKAKL